MISVAKTSWSKPIKPDILWIEMDGNHLLDNANRSSDDEIGMCLITGNKSARKTRIWPFLSARIMHSHPVCSELCRTNRLIRSLRIPSIVSVKSKKFCSRLRTFFDCEKSIRKVVSRPEFHLSSDKVLFSTSGSSDRSLKKNFDFESAKLDHGMWWSKNSTGNTQRANRMRL